MPHPRNHQDVHGGSAIKSHTSKQSKRAQYPRESDFLTQAGSPDELLVRRAQLGERGAFNTLVQRYRHRVMQLSMRYTHNRADAEDVVQNTFIKAYYGLQHFRGESAFYSWLYRIAVNYAHTALSLRARRATLFVAVHEYSNDPTTPSVTLAHLETPEELAQTDEICTAVNASIESLCDEQRAAILLREFEGLNYSQIACAMSCPVGTVRSRVFRAREAIDYQLRRVFDNGLGRAKARSSTLSRKPQKDSAYA